MTGVVDLFAGMGGWDIAARQLAVDPLGIEWNADACATRHAAGLRTVQADIDQLDPADFAPCEGLIASPPCQDFSVAGKGAGRDGDRGRLVDVVPAWVDVLRPRWVACEQVPPVLPIWQEFAHRFRSWGYSTWAGILSAEEFGVPQTRKRAILMASLDRDVTPPAPTHQAYRHGKPAAEEHTMFGTLAPWVSMAEAVGTHRQGRCSRVMFHQWALTRPATTIAGDPRCFQPGGHHEPGQQSENAIRLTLAEGLTLQGFPPDWPVHGTKTAQWLQVGNAIPPPLALAVLDQLVDR